MASVGSSCSASLQSALWRSLDAALGARAVLVELMLVGPAICALGASPRETALVSTLAFVSGDSAWRWPATPSAARST